MKIKSFFLCPKIRRKEKKKKGREKERYCSLKSEEAECVALIFFLCHQGTKEGEKKGASEYFGHFQAEGEGSFPSTIPILPRVEKRRKRKKGEVSSASEF